MSLAENLATGTAGRSLKQGTSFRSSFRSRPQTAASGDGSESQAGVEGMDLCRVDCWNGGYMEAKMDSADVREQQDWLVRNKEVLHELQVSYHSPVNGCSCFRGRVPG